MASNLKRLQDRAAAIAARMTELADVAERSEDQTAELRRLSDEADKVKSDLEFEGSLAAKEAELRAVVEKAAPAPAAAPVAEQPKKTEIRAIYPHHTSLRAFNDGPESVESAYRCGRWIRGHVFKNADDLRWCKDHGVEARALGENSNASGGALVPEEFAARVIRLVETYGTFPGAAENVTMARDTMVIPKRVSGVTAYFVGEGGAVAESDPVYTNVSLVAKKLAVATRYSMELSDDAVIGIADAIAAEFSTNLAYRIDLCGWISDGTSQYGGMFGIVEKINDGTHTQSVVNAIAGNNAFENLDIEDFLNVMGRLPIYARQGAAWYISPAGKAASIDRLKYAAGGNTASDLGADGSDRFLGYPVRLVHVMNSTLGSDANKIKVLFGNMSLSSIYARRRDFGVRLFDQVYATTEQLLLQGSMRFDINHHSLGTNSEAGPVIALRTTA